MKYFLYFVLVLLACTFHRTAVVAFLFPLIARLRYTRNTTVIILVLTAIATITNFTSYAISAIGLGTGYVTTEVGNMANVSVVSLLFIALLFLRAFTVNKDEANGKNDLQTENFVFGESFYTYCIAFSFSVTVMSLRAAGMSRLNMYLQTVGLPYISNVMNRIENPRLSFLIKVVFSGAVWGYSAVALLYRPEWQHIWPYYFYWHR